MFCPKMAGTGAVRDGPSIIAPDIVTGLPQGDVRLACVYLTQPAAGAACARQPWRAGSLPPASPRSARQTLRDGQIPLDCLPVRNLVSQSNTAPDPSAGSHW